MGLRPVDGQRRARREHQNNRLAEGLQRLEQLLLRPRQAQIRAVTTRETGIVDLHLLAFDVSCESSHEYDNVGFARHIERFLEQRLESRKLPGQPHFCIARLLEVLQADVACLPRLELERHALALQARSRMPFVQQEPVIDVQAEPIVRAHFDLVTARNRGHQLTAPADTEVLRADRRFRAELAPLDQILGR